MSVYNQYAKKLNKAFQDMAEEYGRLATAVNGAKNRLNDYPESHPGTVYDAEKRAAQARLDAETAKLNTEAPRIMERFCDTVDSLTAQVKKAVADSNVVNPAEIDGNALELLKSGVMTVSDYAAMVDRYSGNKTMLRLIGKYADDARKDAQGAEDRQRLAAVSIVARENSTGAADRWEWLASAAKTYSGKNSSRSVSYVQAMQEHWNEADIQAAIENF